MPGLSQRLKNMDQDRVSAFMMLFASLGQLLGRGGRAMRVLFLLDEYPGRVAALRSGQEKLDKLADEVEDLIEKSDDPAAELTYGEQTFPLTLTGSEVMALDDWKDLQSKTGRALKRLVRRGRDKEK